MNRIFWLIWHFLTHRWTRYAAAWLVALGIAGWQQYLARRSFRSQATEPEKQRRDGNDGHTSIDFAGQWLMGRMLMTGHAHELYDRRVQFEVAQAAFPREREAPAAPNGHDAENLVLAYFMDPYGL